MRDAEDVRVLYQHVVSSTRLPDHPLPLIAVVESSALAPAERAADAGEQVQAAFALASDLQTALVYVRGIAIGVVERDDYPDVEVTTAPSENFRADNDGQSLPGRSQHYVAFAYRCGGCARTVYTPAPVPPACPACAVRTEAVR